MFVKWPRSVDPAGGYADTMRMALTAAGQPRAGALRLGPYLPVSVVVTAAVTLLPLAVVSQLGRANGPLALMLHVIAAVLLSMLIARVLAALWTRHERSTDLVFGDLLIWGWVRRALAERRLEAAAQELTNPASSDAHANLLRRMSALLEARDPYTHGHSRRVARHAERIARELGLPPEHAEKIRAAALVHDIGKINVPRPILTKPGNLTDQEFALVKRHAADGAAMVASLGDPELTAIVRSHHERIDGTGYPDGLAGADIPLGARIIAVADTFDAITSVRPYRHSRTHKQALDVLQSEAGRQLDAAAVAAFASYYTAHRSVGWASVMVAGPQRVLSGVGGVSTGLGAGVVPLAQTACGVGGIALAGMCLGGAALPAGSIDEQAASQAGRSKAVVAQVVAAPPAAEAGSRGHARPQRHVRVSEDRTGAPQDRVRSNTRALRGPADSGGGSSVPAPKVTGPGSAVDSAGDTVDDLPNPTDATPVQLPDVGEVVEGVTDQLPPLPQVQAPQLKLKLLP
jgi:putative nucleotidyltransferase with HDIG domain